MLLTVHFYYNFIFYVCLWRTLKINTFFGSLAETLVARVKMSFMVFIPLLTFFQVNLFVFTLLQYKDAFLSANPDFKWYKLPAPPLRTLNTRPANSVPKPILPIATTPLTVSPAAAEFTPGKLADESQLGGLTSLMNMSNGFNNNNNSTSNYNNNKEPVSLKRDYETTDQVFDFSMKKSLSEPYREPELPPKPIKKRIFEKFVDNKDDNIFGISEDGGCEPNMTQQELLNKVVDHMFIQDADLSEQPRKKSGRSCKGKRYEQFMVEGKLLSGKREKNQKFLDVNRKFDDELHSKIETFQNRETLNLESTIKRLAERTQTENPKIMEEIKFDQEKRKRTVSEASDDSFTRTVQNEFNLDLRISNLPSLSYDAYMQRKRESKKRKICTKSDYPDSSRHGKVSCVSPIGSKKRKNKHSITHLKKKTPDIGSSNITSDLSGLATLAEIAANTEKIN